MERRGRALTSEAVVQMTEHGMGQAGTTMECTRRPLYGLDQTPKLPAQTDRKGFPPPRKHTWAGAAAALGLGLAGQVGGRNAGPGLGSLAGRAARAKRRPRRTHWMYAILLHECASVSTHDLHIVAYGLSKPPSMPAVCDQYAPP